jgi:PKD repeat protein
VYAGNGNDSTAVFNQIVVNPTPVANFYSYEVNPEEGSDTVQFADNSLFATSWLWDFGDPASGADNSSTEQSPVHVFTSNGSYSVTLWVSNTYGCSDSITITSQVNVGLAELETVSSSIFPNPTTGELNIITTALVGGEMIVDVKDIVGRQLKLQQLNLVSGINRNVVDLTQLPTGTYVMTLRSGSAQQTHRFVIME